MRGRRGQGGTMASWLDTPIFFPKLKIFTSPAPPPKSKNLLKAQEIIILCRNIHLFSTVWQHGWVCWALECFSHSLHTQTHTHIFLPILGLPMTSLNFTYVINPISPKIEEKKKHFTWTLSNLIAQTHTHLEKSVRACMLSYRWVTVCGWTQRSSEDSLDAPEVSITQVCGADNQVVARAARHPGGLARFGAHKCFFSHVGPGCRRCPMSAKSSPAGRLCR